MVHHIETYHVEGGRFNRWEKRYRISEQNGKKPAQPQENPTATKFSIEQKIEVWRNLSYKNR